VKKITSSRKLVKSNLPDLYENYPWTDGKIDGLPDAEKEARGFLGVLLSNRFHVCRRYVVAESGDQRKCRVGAGTTGVNKQLDAGVSARFG
jgi:hypothetical protein